MNIKVMTIVALCIAAVNSLKCYECINCPTVTSKQLVKCGSEWTTISPSSTTSTPTTTANNTTQPPSNSTTQPPLTTPTNSTTNPPLTTQPPTNSTTNPAVTTQQPTNSTTNPPLTTQPPTNSTSNSSLTTQPSTNNTTNAPHMTEQPAANKTRDSTLLQHSRSKGDISFVSPKQVFEGSEDKKKAIVTYYCYKAIVKYNKTFSIVQRGCAEKIHQNETLCDNVPKDIEVKACTTCESDQCNGAFTRQLSFFSMIIMLLLSFVV